MKKHLKILGKLQKQRGNIPTYVLFDDILPQSFIKIKNNLAKYKGKSKEVDIVLFSSGGQASDAYRMIRTFRSKFEIVNVIVPFWAKSAATLFALGATRLVLHECGELGPIDAQIKTDDDKEPEGQWASALNVQSSLAQIEKRSREGMIEMFGQLRDKKINKKGFDINKIGRKDIAEMLLNYSAEFYTPLLQKIDALELGKMARVLDVGRMYARRILKQYTPTSDANIDGLLYFLVYECPDHGYVVDYDVLKVFLPFVIKGNEPPFGTSYSKNLGELANLLISEKDPEFNDFFSNLQP